MSKGCIRCKGPEHNGCSNTQTSTPKYMADNTVSKSVSICMGDMMCKSEANDGDDYSQHIHRGYQSPITYLPQN